MSGVERTLALRDGTRLHTRVWGGDGPGVLLVHGLASNLRLWTGVAELLATDGHRVVAVDQRAHGRSDPSDVLDLATLTDDLVEVIAAHGLDRPVAVGQSWGGNVVVELGARHPEAVRAVVGVDGGHLELADRFATPDEAWAILAPPDWDAQPRTWATIVAAVTERTAGWPPFARDAQLANLAARADGTATAVLTRARHRAILDGMHAHRPSRRLADVPIPVWLAPVRPGASDERAVARVVTAAPDVTVRWIEDRDHDVHAQDPDLVADLVREVLRTST